MTKPSKEKLTELKEILREKEYIIMWHFKSYKCFNEFREALKKAGFKDITVCEVLKW